MEKNANDKLIWVDIFDNEIGSGDKLETHVKNQLHRAFSVFIVHDGKMLIQRRALGKYHSAGLWANACCSHPRWGESLADAVQKRMEEELGIAQGSIYPEELFSFNYFTQYDGLSEYEIEIYDNEEPIEKEVTTKFQLASPGIEGAVGGVNGVYILNVNNRMGLTDDGTFVLGGDMVKASDGLEIPCTEQYLMYNQEDGVLRISTSDGDHYNARTDISNGIHMWFTDDTTGRFKVAPFSQMYKKEDETLGHHQGVKMDIGDGSDAMWLVKVPEKYAFLREEAEASGNGEYINLFDILNNLLMP